MTIDSATMSAASPASDDDLATVARICMVNSQIRPNRVNDPRILAAMRRIPREGFVPAARRHMAYLDEDVPLGHDRFLMEPMVLARMLKAANPRDGERALVVAAGAGYGAAVLDACGCKVFALEEDPDLIRLAREVLPREAPNVTLVTGPLADGWAAEAPFDLIVIEGAVPEVPAALTGQLAPVTGRLLTVLDTGAGITQAVIGEMTAAGLRTCPLFDCGTPLLPSLRKAPVFEF